MLKETDENSELRGRSLVSPPGMSRILLSSQKANNIRVSWWSDLEAAAAAAADLNWVATAAAVPPASADPALDS